MVLKQSKLNVTVPPKTQTFIKKQVEMIAALQIAPNFFIDKDVDACESLYFRLGRVIDTTTGGMLLRLSIMSLTLINYFYLV